ncbi:hypothetical protein [Cyclobacterium marinum]|uniref:Uncharacterized protein n=1 Tax=Cyclobacterium marinum (strain ATCC 25205 / DSM 745 / LMG 13164 / NCIMB 1802) TaxID=880070 RepID=G0IY28_CYCMS|nr:hypothetical protein [Cyclobacterium marinum]AEL24361.1 hypothetical protein Cycma_0586 [Cyclobacterium marinum DSM 745]
MANKSIPELTALGRTLVNEDLLIIRGFTEDKDLKLSFSQLVSAIAGSSMSAEQIRDLLETLGGADRLDASAIKNLPDGLDLSDDILDALEAANLPSDENPFATLLDLPTTPQSGNRIITPGELVINSTTSATLTGLKWVWDGVIKTYTGSLVLTDSPTTPNNRFDIISVSAANTPLVETGTADPEPAVPNPATSGHISVHTIYRPFNGEDSSQPNAPASVYSTKNQAGRQNKYAPIWRQSLLKNTSYDFKIGFVGWASDYSSNSQRPLNGYVAVNFIATNAQIIDSNRVKVQSNDVSFQSGDFVLVQTDTTEATLFVKKTAYFQTLFFNFLGAKNSTVKDDSLLNLSAYDDLPAGDSYGSWNGRSFVPSTGTTINFDKPRSYGMNGTPVTGNLTIATALADDSVMVKVLHNDSTEPTISVPGGVTKRLLSGEYVADEGNVYLFIIDKDSAGDVKAVNYTITQNTL